MGRVPWAVKASELSCRGVAGAASAQVLGCLPPRRRGGIRGCVRSLIVPRLATAHRESWLSLTQAFDRSCAGDLLTESPWSDFPYHPSVRFAIAHDDAAIYLRFSVREQAVLARWTHTNDPVSEDSCVELFLAPGPDERYYNFEFNCIGTCLAAVGHERNGREILPAAKIDLIRRRATLGSEPIPVERKGDIRWELFAAIPVSLFVRNFPKTLNGRRMKANLYKCGDRLEVPHYLSWNRVESPRPDYHRPEFFGELLFA